MLASAEFSPCSKYRYALRRVWDPSSPSVLFVLLNPSTADARRDDPTIRRCIGYARDWGYGGLLVGNLFAYRATNPACLKTARDPVGPENDKWLQRLARDADMVVAGWGEHGKLYDRDQEVRPLLPAVHILATTKAGRPRHPLYLRRALVPRAWTA